MVSGTSFTPPLPRLIFRPEGYAVVGVKQAGRR